MPITTDHLRNTRADYAERLDSLGVHYPARATKADLHRLLFERLGAELDAAHGVDRDEMAGELVDLDARRKPDHAEQETPGTPETEGPTEGFEAVESAGVLEVAVPHETLPTPSRWEQLRSMAAVLANSRLVRPTLRGQPDDVTLILLTGHDLGISSTMALSKVNVIEGMPSISAELMTALVRRAGHRLWGETSGQGATVHGARRESPDEVMSVTFSLDDAVAAGLCGIKDGRAHARSRQGRPLPWESYTADMLWARAVSRLSRRLFSDVLAGMTYTPEELGSVSDGYGTTDAYGEDMPVIRSSRVGPVPDDCGDHDDSGLCCVTVIRARIDALPDEQRADVAAAWKAAQERRELPALKHLDWPAVPLAGTIVGMAEQAARDAQEAAEGIVEAEVVGVPTTVDGSATVPLGDEGVDALGVPTCPTCLDAGTIVDVETGEVADCPTCGPM